VFGLLLGVWSGFFVRDVRFGLGGGVADGVVVVVVYCLSLRVGRCAGWLWFSYGQLCWGSRERWYLRGLWLGSRERWYLRGLWLGRLLLLGFGSAGFGGVSLSFLLPSSLLFVCVGIELEAQEISM